MRMIVLCSVLTLTRLAAETNTAPDLFTSAVTTGDLATVDTLLSSGLDPNLPDRHGQTPLCLALLSGQNRVLQLLLDRHADPNAPLSNSPFPSRPLEYALEYGNIKAVSSLIAAGARVEPNRPGERTPLHLAVAGGHLDMLQLLIEKGADVDARDREGASALDDAVWRGSLDAVAILLAHGASLNDPDTRTGATPINEAAWSGNTAIVRYLLRFHPDLTVPDRRGYNPFQNAIRMRKEDSAMLLLEAEPAQEQTPEFFQQAMDAAIPRNEGRLVEALLRHGAPVNDVLPSGATPLEAAASGGSIEAVRAILKHGGDPNAEGRNGTSPLEEASLKGFDAIVGLLLDGGAAIDRRNAGSGTTALYAAAAFGKAGAVKTLLDRGANPGLCGENRKTPYAAALANGFPDVAAQIQQRGGGKVCVR